jgi:hypothetical protein
MIEPEQIDGEFAGLLSRNLNETFNEILTTAKAKEIYGFDKRQTNIFAFVSRTHADDFLWSFN